MSDVEVGDLCSENSRVCMRDALVYYEKMLAENDLIEPTASATITEQPMLLAEDLFQYTLEILQEKKFVSFDELILFDEHDEENLYKEIDRESSSEESSDNYEPPEKKANLGNDLIPLEYKRKVVSIAAAYPKWSLAALQKNGCSRLKRMEELPKWVEHVKCGGTKFDKYATIDSWTYDRFKEARENNQQVTTRSLQQWALSAASQFKNFDFKASKTWAKDFKVRHRIRQRKITKFVTERETASMDEILAAAEDFRIQARNVIPNFEPDFVITTDQTGCQYQSTSDRTLATKASKMVLVTRQNTNKVTHSYTAQYSVTLSGKLLPLVFICLQETTGSFAPRVKKSVDEYLKKYRNVTVTSSKSGKLTTNLYKDFLNHTLKPYVEKKKFLLLIDSRGGQTNPVIYDEIFRDDQRLPTCTVQVVPPKCTALVQPCGVYFYRQVQNFTKRLQNCAYLIESGREINDREDCIKIHSIVHHQLSSPVFGKMIRYAWFASKLSDTREIFQNVNEVCFAIDVLKKHCSCKNAAFVRCARCRVNYCFPCFYDAYHCGSCDSTPAV